MPIAGRFVGDQVAASSNPRGRGLRKHGIIQGKRWVKQTNSQPELWLGS